MIDAHVHFLHSTIGEYTFEHLDRIVMTAVERGIEEVYLLEHTHQFREFKKVYKPIANYNAYQNEWLKRKTGGTIEGYLKFIEQAKKKDYPVKIKFGLEVCYIPESEDSLATTLNQYSFDFLTGAVHYIDNWGFDHKAEFWQGVHVDSAYKRYYEIMSDLIETGIFGGVAHPDSIKCFNHHPSNDLVETYTKIAEALIKKRMYAEQSGGLALNYKHAELGMNQLMLNVFRKSGVSILSASDAHRVEDVGANVKVLKLLCEKI